MRRLNSAYLLLWLGAALLLTGAAPTGSPAPFSFRLSDQFERPHDAATLLKKNRPIILLGGDSRQTRPAIGRWLSPLRKALGARALVLGYVDLRNVPFFVPRGLVRRGLKKALPSLPVLCDYKGRVASKLGFTPKTVIEVRVFDRKGRPVGGVKGAYSSLRIARLRALIDAL